MICYKIVRLKLVFDLFIFFFIYWDRAELNDQNRDVYFICCLIGLIEPTAIKRLFSKIYPNFELVVAIIISFFFLIDYDQNIIIEIRASAACLF